MANEIPVYMITGFLEGGKTSFLKFTLQQDYFNDGSKTLLILCEEGETELDQEFMDKYLVAQENSKSWNMEIIKHDYPQDYIGYLIDMIDEPLAKMALLRKYYEIFGEKKLALKAQINEHRRAIAALEAKLKDNQ